MINGDILPAGGGEPRKADVSLLAELGIDAMTSSSMRIANESELSTGPVEPTCPPTEIADNEPNNSFGEPSELDLKPFVEVSVQPTKVPRAEANESASKIQEEIPKRSRRIDEDEHRADDGYGGLFKRPRHHK